MTCTELTALGVDLYWPGTSNPVPNLVSLYAYDASGRDLHEVVLSSSSLPLFGDSNQSTNKGGFSV
jgi:hypothetical protein